MTKKFTIEKKIHLILVLIIYALFTTLVIIPRDWNGNTLLIFQYYVGISSSIIIFYSQIFWLFPKYFKQNQLRYIFLLTLLLLGLFLIHSTLQTIDLQTQGVKKYNIYRPFFEAYIYFFTFNFRWLKELFIVLLVSLGYSGIKVVLQKGLLKVKTLVVSISVIIVVGFLSVLGFYFYKLSYAGDEKIKFINNSEQFKKIDDLIGIKEFNKIVLYIDIWEPNCGPCLKEFQYSKDLKERYKDKPIKFVYLTWLKNSIDIPKWKGLIKKYEIIGYHMRINTDFYNNIWDIKEIKDKYMIPHYILIDKNGNIIYPNAERPSAKEKLYEQIDSLL